MTIGEILKKQNGIDKIDAELLLSYALKKTREFVVAHPEKKVKIRAQIKFWRLVRQRKQGYSTAALIRHKDFFGLSFFVDKNVLIPRPATELMVEKVIAKINLLRDNQITLVDVGTGTGCIIISVLKNVLVENFKAVGIDISRKALKVAKKNAGKHKVQIEFLKGNLLEPFFNHQKILGNLIVTANLPYLTQKQFLEEPSIQKEPKNALVADENGLKFYRQLLEQIKKNVSNETRVDIFLEIDPKQKKSISELILSFFGNARVEFYKDLSGDFRVVEISIG